MPSRAVLITGCSTGIGKHTAIRLARAGHPVYATVRRPEDGTELTAAGCHVLTMDVRDEASTAEAVAAVEAAEGAVGVLVNNAGYAPSGAVEAVPLDAVRAQFETNVFGYLRMAQLVLPGMRRQRQGRIINVSSLAGEVVFPGAGIYAASKHAVEALSDALRFEVRGFGVHVSVIQPGPIRTGFTSTATTSMPKPTGPDDPYAAFHAAVAKADADTDNSAIAGKPEHVAAAIAAAVTARRPKPRYRVTAVAHLMPAVHDLLPDRVFDAFLRTQASPPSA